MIINNKILNLPPYISTTWNNVLGLHMKGTTLVISLSTGESVLIDDLSKEVIETIFHAHRSYLEEQDFSNPGPTNQAVSPFGFLSQPLSNASIEFLQFGQNAIKGLGAAMQHDDSLADAPDLPAEFLEKIAAIAKIVTPESQDGLPKGELNCNCPHCQIANAINGQSKKNVTHHASPAVHLHDEPVSAEDLIFQEWKIQQTGTNLYQVTNNLDPKEIYQVYLGDPIGCTCGEKNCVHIPAVLKS
ncbi:MAG: hypothetical protein H0U49_05035 [Parachlamydiaceae bacterium]|nr:hypothetical protein [Parachlamydiaceae bacterium]